MYNIETKTQQEELSGVIDRITFYNEMNGFCVFKLQSSSNKFKNLILENCEAELFSAYAILVSLTIVRFECEP